MQRDSTAVQPSNGEHFWFLNALVRVRFSAGAGTDATCVTEHWAPPGDSPPLHLHRNEDEIFYVLEGECRFRVEDSEKRGHPGDTLIAPKVCGTLTALNPAPADGF
jgi:uncharacterized cupin superfamily protein